MPWWEQNIGMGGALSAKQQTSADSRTESLQPLSDERRDFIQKSLDAWCANLGYKDSTVNMLTLSRTLCISKDELSVFFDQYLKTTFRIWLGDIRFNAAKKMMLEFPDYSNDIISAECGFSARTYLYRIFKSKEGCTPTEWREEQVQMQHQMIKNRINHFSINIRKTHNKREKIVKMGVYFLRSRHLKHRK